MKLPVVMCLALSRCRIVLTLVALAAVIQCRGGGRPLRCGGSTEVDESALRPRLLLDGAEIAKYLDDFPSGQYQIHAVPGLGKFYLDDNPARVKRRLRQGKRWEEHQIAVFEKYTRKGSTALDVGAHIGSHTLTLARLVGPAGRVFAFEPQRKVFRELVQNLRLNGLSNVVPLRFAIGAEQGIIQMDPVRGPDGQVAVGTGGDRAELRTIDSFGFGDVSLVKIDVEGYEGPVLDGAEKTIRACHPVVVVELLGIGRYDQLGPEARAGIDRATSALKRLGYRYEVIQAGTDDFVATYAGGR